MRRSAFLLTVLVVATWSPIASTDEAVIVPPEVLAAIVDDEIDPLPRHMTPEERLLPIPRPDLRLPLLPPSGSVVTPPEYADNDGLLIRWAFPNDLHTAMTVGITTGDPEAVVYIVVYSPSLQTSATNTLTSAGADMSQVEFILYSTDSAWMRDYGPRFIREDDHRAMVDHTYNRNRPNDNLFPDHLAPLWGEPQYDIPLTHGGGNFHLFGTGEAFMTDLILDENPGLTAADVEGYYAQYQNLDLTIFPRFPYSFDTTGHIDMWMLPVSDHGVIIGQYAPGDGSPYTITENAVTELQSRGYTVHRTPGWDDGRHITYTNSVVFNDLVFACQFDTASTSYEAEDAAALATFGTAFPGKQIIPVDCSDIIGDSGAVHCIVMHVPEGPSIFADNFESGNTMSWSASVP